MNFTLFSNHFFCFHSTFDIISSRYIAIFLWQSSALSFIWKETMSHCWILKSESFGGNFTEILKKKTNFQLDTWDDINGRGKSMEDSTKAQKRKNFGKHKASFRTKWSIISSELCFYKCFRCEICFSNIQAFSVTFILLLTVITKKKLLEKKTKSNRNEKFGIFL